MKRFSSLARLPMIWVSLGLISVGCFGGGADNVENRSEALTAEQQNILGFEQPNLWSSPAGPIATLSNDHTQGQKSLQVTPKGYVPYVSNALTSLGPVGSTLFYDLKIPIAQANKFWFGASQVFISIPSKNVYNFYAGQVELTGLPLDKWTTLSFGLTAGITQTLGTSSYSDLKFTIVLNVPSNANGIYLIDNLRFSAPANGGTGGAVGTGGQGTGGRVGTGGVVGTGGRVGTGGVVGTGGQGTGGQGTGGQGTGGQGTGGRVGTGGVVGTGGQGTGGQGTGGRVGTGGVIGTGGRVGTGGQGTGGQGTGGQGTGGQGTGGQGTGGQGTGGRIGTGGVVGTGGQGTGGQGTGGQGTGGQGTGGQGTGGQGTGGQGTGGQGTGGQGTGGQGTGGQGTGGQGGNACTQPPSKCVSQACLDCTDLNCSPSTDGCDTIADPAERQLCENLFACAAAPSHPGASITGPCTSFGDPTACWCGTNPTTCLSTPTGAGAGNGPCLQEVFAAAHTTDPGTIKLRFIDPSFALGRAFNLVSCRGAFCGTSPGTGAGECLIP